MALTPDQVASGSPCYCLTGTDFEKAALYLLYQIYLTTGGTPMTVTELAAASKCFCFTGVNFEKASIYLMAQIAENTTPA